jgi:hypothetical protein
VSIFEVEANSLNHPAFFSSNDRRKVADAAAGLKSSFAPQGRQTGLAGDPLLDDRAEFPDLLSWEQTVVDEVIPRE